MVEKTHYNINTVVCILLTDDVSYAAIWKIYCRSTFIRVPGKYDVVQTADKYYPDVDTII